MDDNENNTTNIMPKNVNHQTIAEEALVCGGAGAIVAMRSHEQIEKILLMLEDLPKTLRNRAHFCVWRYELTKDRRTKVPYNPLTGQRANSSDISTFANFDQAVEALRSGKYDGLGVGIDAFFDSADNGSANL